MKREGEKEEKKNQNRHQENAAAGPSSLRCITGHTQNLTRQLLNEFDFVFPSSSVQVQFRNMVEVVGAASTLGKPARLLELTHGRPSRSMVSKPCSRQAARVDLTKLLREQRALKSRAAAHGLAVRRPQQRNSCPLRRSDLRMSCTDHPPSLLHLAAAAVPRRPQLPADAPRQDAAHCLLLLLPLLFLPHYLLAVYLRYCPQRSWSTLVTSF